MLLQITRKCLEECSHCMVDAKPEGEHISFDLFKDVLCFVRDVCLSNFVLISGGEPVLHPDFYKLCAVARYYAKNSKIILLSSGHFVRDPILLNKVSSLIKDYNVSVQVRTHKKYYKNYEEISSRRKEIEAIGAHFFDDGIDQLIDLGRAKNLALSDEKKKLPSCVNFFLLAKQMPFATFNDLISVMEMRGKFCTPMIDIQGNVYPGESHFCNPIGNIHSSSEDIMKFLRYRSPYDCNHCKSCRLIEERYPQVAQYLKSN